MQGNVKATAEQVAYAKLLDLGMKVGLAALVVTFVIYLTGILPHHTPVNDLPKYWKMPVKQYLLETKIDRHSDEYAQIPAAAARAAAGSTSRRPTSTPAGPGCTASARGIS